MSSAHLLRIQIESALAHRIPSALTPAPRVIRPTAPTGVAALDEPLNGGLPLGGISELSGPECSGRTSLALSFVAGFTQGGRVCAWIDASDSLDPESAAAAGVDLHRLLWIRCGAQPRQLNLPGFVEPHSSAAHASSQPALLSRANSAQQPIRADFAPRCAEPQPRRTPASRESREAATPPPQSSERNDAAKQPLTMPQKPWSRLDQALRAADLLLQAGGFSCLVLDMGSIAAEFALRVPLATWFRYRAAAERTQAAFLLLTQQPCTKSSAALVLHLSPGARRDEGGTVLTAAEYRVAVARERFTPPAPFGRKPPRSALEGEGGLRWQTRAAWSAVVGPTASGSRKAGCP
jgi:recombination protein RecA